MSQLQSPFKFLDSYQQEDGDIFFGRARETEALYQALSGVKHLLVYGPSGAGKTSLIECGLRNQFSDADWFALTIRRGNHLTASVFARINEALQQPLALDAHTALPANGTTDFGEAIETLYAERYQPIYLLFDQFEELLISGDKAEQADFFQRLNGLIRYKVPCRVMLIMREEFIGHLSEFEALCPSIFQHRFRLEKMGRSHVHEVLHQMLNAPHYHAFFRVDDSAALAAAILSKLPDEKREIELAHVQVFLAELWDRADQAKGSAALPLLHQALIKEEDNLEGVLNKFLNTQFTALESIHGEKAPLELLAAMISEKHTKLQLSETDLQHDLATKQVKISTPLPALLNDLEQRRIIRTLKAGEQTRYEISHDVLALVVGQNLTEAMQMRQKAERTYTMYLERKEPFTQGDINYLRPFEAYRSFPPALNGIIKEREQELKEEQDAALNDTRKRLRTVRMVLVFALLALGVAGFLGVYASRQQRKAEQQSMEKGNALIQYKKEQAKNQLYAFDERKGRASLIVEQKGCPLEILQEMRNIAKDHPDSVKMFQEIKDLTLKNPNCK
jgi:GTPase SAR1 family protein